MLCEEAGLAMTVDCREDHLLSLEDVQGAYSTIRVKVTPEPVEEVLSIFPAATDEENPFDSSDEDELEAEDKSGTSSAGVDEQSMLDDDNLDDGKDPFLLEIPPGYVRRKRLST